MNRLARTLVLTLAIGLPALLKADVYMKQKHHTDPMTLMGKTVPAKDVIHEVWFTPQERGTTIPERSMIFRLDKNVIYILDHKRKPSRKSPSEK